jgi:hypothetical protein
VSPALRPTEGISCSCRALYHLWTSFERVYSAPKLEYELQLTIAGSTPASIARKKLRVGSSPSKSSTPVSPQTTSLTPTQNAEPAAPNAITARFLVPPPSLVIPATADAQQAPVSATLHALGVEMKQSLLNQFRDEMACHFPFLATCPLFRNQAGTEDPDLTSIEQKAPFSTAAICMAALHRHCSLQKRTSQELLASLASVMIMQGRKSMDLLYCLLVLEACESYT